MRSGVYISSSEADGELRIIALLHYPTHTPHTYYLTHRRPARRTEVIIWNVLDSLDEIGVSVVWV